MKDYLAEGVYHQYLSMGRDIAGRRQMLTSGLEWHAEHAKTHIESQADTQRMRAMLDELETVEKQLDAVLKKLNEAANLAGLKTLTRTGLTMPKNES